MSQDFGFPHRRCKNPHAILESLRTVSYTVRESERVYSRRRKQYGKKTKINLFNKGNHSRDFTYISDIVDGIVLAVKNPAKKNKKWSPYKPDPSSSIYPFRIYNIGSNKRTNLIEYLKLLETK